MDIAYTGFIVDIFRNSEHFLGENSACIIMATATRYTVSFLRSIRLKTRDRDSYEQIFFIPAPVYSWIIALGTKLQPRPYRRSREGQNQFFKIVSMVKGMHSHHSHCNHYVNSDNLCSIKCCANTAPIKSMSITFNC